MHILLIGDVVGNSGCCFLQESRHGKNADDSEHRRQSADAGKNRRCRVQQQCGGGQRARQTVEIRVRGVDGRTGKPDQTAGLFRGQTAGFHARPYVAVAGGGTHGPANAAGRAVGGHRRAFPRQRGAGRPADETLLCPMRVPSSAVGTTAGRSADAAGRPLFLPSDRQPACAVVPASRYREVAGRKAVARFAGRTAVPVRRVAREAAVRGCGAAARLCRSQVLRNLYRRALGPHRPARGTVRRAACEEPDRSIREAYVVSIYDTVSNGQKAYSFYIENGRVTAFDLVDYS